MDQLHQLFDDYLQYRKHTSHYRSLKSKRTYLSDLKLTKPRLEALSRMVAWCSERRLDPRLWLYFLFSSQRWYYPPNFEGSGLTPEKKIPQFHQHANFAGLHKIRMTQERDEIKPTQFDPNRDISNTAEQAKRVYLYRNDSQTCMAKMQSETFGYHPRSMTCARCPSQAECSSRLQSMVAFDIMKLRQGQITSTEAQDLARMRTCWHGRG